MAYDLARHVGHNEDPWPVVDRMFKEPKALLSAAGTKLIGKERQAVWKGFAEDRRALLKLISRFEITPDQAKLIFVEEIRNKSSIACTDRELLDNPYRLFEITRMTTQPISLATVDRGLFPESIISDKHPLPAPSQVATATDVRRIRAWSVQTLEIAAASGDSLLPRADGITAIRERFFKVRSWRSCPISTSAQKRSQVRA